MKSKSLLFLFSFSVIAIFIIGFNSCKKVASEELAEELRQHVATHMGPIARPEEVRFVDKLPKTRSGKIMRRVLKARAQGLPEGDISTLEE